MQHGLYYQTQVPVFKRTVLNEDWELCAPVEIVARVEQDPETRERVRILRSTTATYASFCHTNLQPQVIELLRACRLLKY